MFIKKHLMDCLIPKILIRRPTWCCNWAIAVALNLGPRIDPTRTKMSLKREYTLVCIQDIGKPEV